MADGKNKIPFYEKTNAYKTTGIIALVGCALMLAATFVYWVVLYVKISEPSLSGTSIFISVFNSLRSHISFSGIVTALFLLLYYAVVALLIILAIYDNLKKEPLLTKWEKRTRFGLVLASLILLIIITHLPSFKLSLTQFYELEATWTSFIKNGKESKLPGVGLMKCSLYKGPGFWCYIAGTVLYLFSIIYNFILDTLNED